MDGICVASDSRFDSKWNLKFQGLLASDLLINAECNWLDWATWLCNCRDKLASFSPWPVSIIEHLDLSNIGRASSDLNHIFRLLLHDCSLLVKRFIKGLSVNPRSLLLFFLWNIFDDELVFRCFDVSGKLLNKLWEDLPLFFLFRSGSSLHGIWESFLHVFAILFASRCFNKSFDLENIIENFPWLFPWFLRSTFSWHFFFLLITLVLSFLLALLWRLGLTLFAELLFASFLWGELVLLKWLHLFD